jgi:hypothetical protein
MNENVFRNSLKSGMCVKNRLSEPNSLVPCAYVSTGSSTHSLNKKYRIRT